MPPEVQIGHDPRMGHQNTEMDVESLQKSNHRRRSCLNIFLVVSIVILFVAVTVVAVCGAIAVVYLRSKLEPGLDPVTFASQTLKLTGDTSYTTYKNFAYIEANSSPLKNSTMHYNVAYYGGGNSVGSNFVFNSEEHSLKPVRAGIYFMYIYLNLTCPFKCKAGLLTVKVGDKLTCKVELPRVADSTPVSRKCWAVSWINAGNTLFTHITVPKEGLEFWNLQPESSGFGMFLVD